MSLTVKHLNADSTFLLTFAPDSTPSTTPPTTTTTSSFSSSTRIPGAFTILLDPWLSGPSQIIHPILQISAHTVPPCITSLDELPNEPDMIVISQDKPDHCHEETLRQLSPTTRTTILATAAAARKIRGWKHFDPARVRTIKKYDELRDDSVHRVTIPPVLTAGTPGEVTIVNLPAKADVTGLHNAIGITYRPPSSVPCHEAQSNLDLPLTPPASPRHRSSLPPPTDADVDSQPPHSATTPTPATASTTTAPPSPPSASSPLSSSRSTPTTLSLLYSPHGVPASVLSPYISSHLRPLDALPLALLLHPLNRVTNPWYLGGVVSAGSLGGVDICRSVGVRRWISAHDEDKGDQGLLVGLLRFRHFGVEEVRGMLEQWEGKEEARVGEGKVEGGNGREEGKKGRGTTRTEVGTLDVGEEIRLTP
ncbi:hypothetical protein B0A49_08689 [Cryomyces minteri]|uniref:Uncharacterized protein n=1 Tax=Cryomyces minteri TaxID=331657 RepID=A0A4U0WUA9_9PEZI|nr:hypothetical protein B0A49_08689 [Cryomyces minteri]